MNISTPLKSAFRGLIGLLIVLLLAVPGSASQTSPMLLDVEAEPALALPQTDAGAATPPARGLSDRTELAAFMDDIFNSQIAAQAAPGAAVAVVKDGELWFAKGYGYADLDQQIPVDAEKTLFRVASISKLFTATATLQLQEQGLLNLEDDITAYLGDRPGGMVPVVVDRHQARALHAVSSGGGSVNCPAVILARAGLSNLEGPLPATSPAGRVWLIWVY